MAIIARERPGVYSDYETSGILYTKNKGKSIAIIAKTGGQANKVYTITRLTDVETIFGTSGLMLSLCKTAFENGAYSITAVSVGSSDENYETAFSLIEEISNVSVVICDSSDTTIQQLLLQSVNNASQNKRERIGIIFSGTEQTDISEWASNFNNERIVLIAQNPIDSEGNALSGGILAAAMASVISQCTDFSQSFNGMSLEGISGLNETLSENEIDSYITSGITPFEIIAGKVEIIRAVTSKTSTNGVTDKTFKELNTILTIDEVIKAVRDMLSKNISHTRNNVTTRSAISSQVTVKLQEFLDSNVIDSYVVPNVYQSEDDATVCIVELDFTVAKGINQIHIIANINV